jgi:hypothetical protein
VVCDHCAGTIPSIGPRKVHRRRRAHALAREAFGAAIDSMLHGHDELNALSAIKVAPQ